MKFQVKIKLFLLSVLTMGSLTSVLAQSNCPNSNFLQGSFNNWSCYTGTYTTPGATLGVVAGRHTLINTPGIDPNTCGGLSVLPPGGTVSARLGNNGTNAEGEQLVYSLTVDNSNALFIYKYAAVLEDPGHSAAEQPVFAIRVLDATGNPVTSSCGAYNVYAGQPGQTFNACGGVVWIPWSFVGIDLSAYIGQTISVEFTTKDCSQGGHYGYAYVSAECKPLVAQIQYCDGANNATFTAPSGFQTYQWSNGATTQSTTVSNPVNGSVYTCDLTTFSNQGTCSVTVSAIAQPTQFVPNFNFTTGCVGTQTQFTNTSTVNNNQTISYWIWNFGDGTNGYVQNPNHTYAAPGVYDVRLIVGTSTGCSDTIIKQVEVFPVPTADFSTLNGCLNSSVVFTDNSINPSPNPLIYTWNYGDGTAIDSTDQPNHTYTTAGTYSITLVVRTAENCANSVTHPLTVYAPPIVNAGADQSVCSNLTTTVSGSGAISYTWNNGVTDNVAFAVPATATYIVEGTDANGCKNTDSLVITYLQAPTVDAGIDQTVCENTPVTFSGSGADGYTWDNGITDGQAFTKVPGTYNLTVIGTSLNGCSETDVAVLTVNPSPLVNAGPDQLICIGSSTQVNASGAQNYVWDNGITNNTPFSPASSLTFTVIGTSAEGCSATDALDISLENAIIPDFSVLDTTGCVPFLAEFSNTSTGPTSVSCIWDFGDGLVEDNCSGIVSHLYENANCMDVTLSMQTALGCTWQVTKPNVLCVYPNPVANFVPNPGTFFVLDPISQMSNSTVGAVQYIWNFGDGTEVSNAQNPIHTFNVEPPQNFQVELIAISEHGCTDTVVKTIFLKQDVLIYIPNTFTPDGDEFNQVFQPVITLGVDPTTYELLIFNRWGETVFESNDVNSGWDGTYHGKIVQDGMYTWTVKFKTTYSDEKRTMQGNLNVIR